jgi:hypothetical protein
MKRKLSWRTCPKCKSRATKIFSINSGKLKCQLCDFEYETETCNHRWYDVYKGDYVTGRRCEKCNKQEWY